MDPLALVKLGPLMERTTGKADVTIGLIDGPVATRHRDLAGGQRREISGSNGGACPQANSTACLHGTFVAGILSARRGSVAPAICPDCTLIARPIFAETNATKGDLPSAYPEELAQAILDCIDAGARVLNVSAALARLSTTSQHALEEALDQAATRGVIVVVAAGNQGTLGSTAMTRHPWVIPVVGYDLHGRPMSYSNMGSSLAGVDWVHPAIEITSIGANGESLTLGGTSAAAPFVSGTMALLWSEFPRATATEVKSAVTQASLHRRTVVPPLLDASAAYQAMKG